MNRLFLMVSLLFVFAACDKKDERVLPKTEPANPYSEQDKSKVERDEFIRYAQKELDELAIKVAEVRKKSADLRGKAKANFEHQIERLEQEHKRLEENLATLKAQVGEKWKELKAGITENIGQLKNSIKDAT